MSKRCVSVLLGLCAVMASSASAAAMTAAPGWEASSHSYPTNLPLGEQGTVAVDVYNIGAAAATGPATVTDTLPEGIVGSSSEGWLCTSGSPATCTYELGKPPELLAAGATEEIPLAVEVKAGAAEGVFPNRVSVSGGGAVGEVTSSSSLTIGRAQAGFGFADANVWFANADGTLDTQAGSHPYSVITTYSLNVGSETYPADNEEPRDLTVNLPPGLIGDERAAPRCTRQQFDSEECPASTQVGVAPTGFAFGGKRLLTLIFPLYNLVPPAGTPAEFGFDLLGTHAFFDASVRSGSDYGITVHVGDLPQRSVVAGEVTIWGVPAESSHDAQRCAKVAASTECGLSSGAARLPFLTLPTSCTGPQSFSASGESWRGASSAISFPTDDASGSPSGFTGCERLGFAPSLTIAPDTSAADTPAGLTVDVRTPSQGLLNPEGLATSNIEDAALTLPEGVVVNPGAAPGLAACQLSEDGVETEHPPSCPAASKIGTIEAQTPILEDSLKGNAYLLASNPPELQLLLDAAGDGVELKVIAHIHLNETTGRVTTTLSDLPQAPLTDFKISFAGESQAALTTPSSCGVYNATADFTPWSAPLVPNAFPSSSFAIESGSGGAPCPPSPLPFSPSMVAGSTSDQAGGYTDFSLAITRPDDQQRISAFQFTLPPGLLGMVGSVPLCGEPQAALGDCPPSSEIAYTEAQAGAGPYPLLVPEPGNPRGSIYLTGPYKGAPYGLSIVVPAVAGPFNLGTVVVRGAISINPITAQATVTTDPLPVVYHGVPPDLRTITGVVDRPDFIFNPTSCSPMPITGTVASPAGAAARVQSRFQVGSCAGLLFQPGLSVFASGKTSKANGASLDVRLTYPIGPRGSNQATAQTNIAKVKVELPKQLPARLTTLQKACRSSTFAANPAGCPAASVVGVLRASTPVLPGELTGPAYFVSNGGAKFPELVMVLQTGEVRVDLHGETFISAQGVTSATFANVPDAPLSSFELYMPQGPYSALAANGNLCKSTLTIPTELVAHNGAVIHQNTPIGVSGCPRATKAKTAKKAKRARKTVRRARKVRGARKGRGARRATAARSLLALAPPAAPAAAPAPQLANAITGQAAAVTQTSAQVSLAVDPGGGDTTYVVEYGTSEAYGESAPTPPGDAGSGSETVGETVALSGLAPGVTYHYRASATSIAGTSHGEDRTFTTLEFANPLTIPLAPPLLPTPTVAFPAFPAASELTFYKATGGKAKREGKRRTKAKTPPKHKQKG
jgi:uncharacterized repeat protein (TIGR01451 family)